MILNLNGSINDEMVEKVVSFLNTSQAGERDIYLSSYGGSNGSGLAILNMINDPGTNLIAYNHLESMAFEIFFKATSCHRKLLSGCIGMYHLSKIEVDMNSKWEPNYTSGSAAKMYMREFSHSNNIQFSESLDFSPTEMRKIKKGDDVYFSPSRMLEFLSISNKKK